MKNNVVKEFNEYIRRVQNVTLVKGVALYGLSYGFGGAVVGMVNSTDFSRSSWFHLASGALFGLVSQVLENRYQKSYPAENLESQLREYQTQKEKERDAKILAESTR